MESSAPRRCPKRSSPKPRLRRTTSQPKASRRGADRTDLERAPTDASEAADSPETPLDADADEPSATPGGAERLAPSEVQPPPERTAEIYVLRHPAPMPSSNIVPIRPGALEAVARETALSFPAESVELSRSERDAFREIARALVGRAPASREDHSNERAVRARRRG